MEDSKKKLQKDQHEYFVHNGMRTIDNQKPHFGPSFGRKSKPE